MDAKATGGLIARRRKEKNNGGDFGSKVIHPVSNFEEIRIHFRQDMRLPKIR